MPTLALGYRAKQIWMLITSIIASLFASPAPAKQNKTKTNATVMRRTTQEPMPFLLWLLRVSHLACRHRPREGDLVYPWVPREYRSGWRALPSEHVQGPRWQPRGFRQPGHANACERGELRGFPTTYGRSRLGRGVIRRGRGLRRWEGFGPCVSSKAR